MLLSCIFTAPLFAETNGDEGYVIVQKLMNQPLYHQDPDGPTLEQRVNILVPREADVSDPVFFVLGSEMGSTPEGLKQMYRRYGSPQHVIFVEAEHRGYGKSVSMDADQSNPRYVRIAEAVEDAHQVVCELKKEYPGPWMAAGYSYSGSLAVQFAATYPKDVKVVLCSSGLVEWPFTTSTYDSQVRKNLGEKTYARLKTHVKNLEPNHRFDHSWLEREFLLFCVMAISQYQGLQSYLPMFQEFAKEETPQFLHKLHWMDNLTGGRASKMAHANAKKTLTREEALTEDYNLRTWRYQQMMETGVLLTSSEEDGIFTRDEEDYIEEAKELFKETPQAPSNPPWSLQPMIDRLSVPLIYVRGERDPWMGLGLKKEHAPKEEDYIFVPGAYHCPDLENREIGKEVLKKMLAYTK
jgi:pimeloyl-ACP methyl ester carboxylesterase